MRVLNASLGRPWLEAAHQSLTVRLAVLNMLYNTFNYAKPTHTYTHTPTDTRSLTFTHTHARIDIDRNVVFI